jgi:hypothetical protein
MHKSGVDLADLTRAGHHFARDIARLALAQSTSSQRSSPTSAPSWPNELSLFYKLPADGTPTM